MCASKKPRSQTFHFDTFMNLKKGGKESPSILFNMVMASFVRVTSRNGERKEQGGPE